MSHRHRAEWRRGRRVVVLAVTGLLLQFVVWPCWFELLNFGRP